MLRGLRAARAAPIRAVDKRRDGEDCGSVRSEGLGHGGAGREPGGWVAGRSPSNRITPEYSPAGSCGMVTAVHQRGEASDDSAYVLVDARGAMSSTLAHRITRPSRG